MCHFIPDENSFLIDIIQLVPDLFKINNDINTRILYKATLRKITSEYRSNLSEEVIQIVYMLDRFHVIVTQITKTVEQLTKSDRLLSNHIHMIINTFYLLVCPVKRTLLIDVQNISLTFPFLKST